MNSDLQYVTFRNERIQAGEALTLHPRDIIKKIDFDATHQKFEVIVMRILDFPPDHDDDAT